MTKINYLIMLYGRIELYLWNFTYAKTITINNNSITVSAAGWMEEIV